MAEVLTAIAESKSWLKVQDNAAAKTYSFVNIVPGTLKRTMVLERDQAVARAQSAGANLLHAANDLGIKGVGKLTFTMYTQDMANSDVANGNALDTIRQSYKNTFANYWSTAVTTNPLPGGGRRMLDWILTYVGTGAAAANNTATAAGCVTSISAEKEVDGHKAVDVEVSIFEEFVDA